MESTLDKGWRAKNQEIYDCSQSFSIVNKIFDNRRSSTIVQPFGKEVLKPCERFVHSYFSDSKQVDESWRAKTNFNYLSSPTISTGYSGLKAKWVSFVLFLLATVNRKKIAIILFTAWENRWSVGWLGLTPDRVIWVLALARSLCCVPIPPCRGQRTKKPGKKKAGGGGGGWGGKLWWIFVSSSRSR